MVDRVGCGNGPSWYGPSWYGPSWLVGRVDQIPFEGEGGGGKQWAQGAPRSLLLMY